MRAISSLPVPVSPVISTVSVCPATRSTRPMNLCMTGLARMNSRVIDLARNHSRRGRPPSGDRACDRRLAGSQRHDDSDHCHWVWLRNPAAASQRTAPAKQLPVLVCANRLAVIFPLRRNVSARIILRSDRGLRGSFFPSAPKIPRNRAPATSRANSPKSCAEGRVAGH